MVTVESALKVTTRQKPAQYIQFSQQTKDDTKIQGVIFTFITNHELTPVPPNHKHTVTTDILTL